MVQMNIIAYLAKRAISQPMRLPSALLQVGNEVNCFTLQRKRYFDRRKEIEGICTGQITLL